MNKDKKTNNKKDEIIKGKWWDIRNGIRQTIVAKYDKIKDWKMDPKGYFLIRIDKENNVIRVGYCTFIQNSKTSGEKNFNEMIYEVIGKTAIEINNTLIRENFLSTLQHSGDMGIELCKAEIALKNNLTYIQDKDLVIT